MQAVHAYALPPCFVTVHDARQVQSQPQTPDETPNARVSMSPALVITLLFLNITVSLS
jgi:hypothetical protein